MRDIAGEANGAGEATAEDKKVLGDPLVREDKGGIKCNSIIFV